MPLNGRLFRMAGLLAAIACSSASCQAPASHGAAPQLTLVAPAYDAAGFERSLIEAPATDWSHNTFSSTSLLAGRLAHSARLASRYHTAATAWPAANWSLATGQTVSNAPVFLAADVYAASPQANDRLVYMSNAPTGNKGMFVVNPANGAVLNGTGWDVLTTVGAPAGDKVDLSALATSAQGRQLMFVTKGGYFGAVWSATGAKTAGFTLGTAQQVLGGAPFVDNSMHPGFDTTMEVWCATTNAPATVGQLHHLSCAGGVWSYPGGPITVSGRAANGTAGVVTAAGFKTSPVAWRNKVYIGDVAGRLWEYDDTAKTARYWDLSPMSGLTNDQILAPVAIDFDDFEAVNAIFVPCGTRVFWVNPATTAIVSSQSLVVDTATSTVGPKLQGPLYSYSFTGTTAGPFYATDSASVATTPFFTNNGDSYGNEIVGSDSLNVGDTNIVSGYMLFNIPAAAFGGKLPVKATLTLTNDPYGIGDTSDVGSIFRGSIFLSNGSGADTATVWSSGAFTATNLPRYLPDKFTPAFSSRLGPVGPGGTPYTWDVTGAIDKDNSSFCLIERGAGKHYNPGGAANTTAPGYYGAFAAGLGYPQSYVPNLSVSLSPYGANGAIKCQPALLALPGAPKLYIANSNALFELDYTNAGTYTSSASTRFSLMASGRGGVGNIGVVDATSKFMRNQVSTLLSATGSQYYAYVGDENSVNAPHLNKFKVPFNTAVNSDDLQTVYSMPIGSLRSTPYVISDYFGGSLYLADQAAASTLVRLPQ